MRKEQERETGGRGCVVDLSVQLLLLPKRKGLLTDIADV